MPDAFTVLWTHETCRALRRAGRVGQRPTVAYSGIHASLPPWSGASTGDEVYALHVNRCEVFVVSRMRVLGPARGDCCEGTPTGGTGHDDWWMLGAGGCGATPVHVDGTPVGFDTRVPGELLERLTWRNRRGRTRGLKHVVDGRLERSVGLQGFYRLTAESADELAALLDAAGAAATGGGGKGLAGRGIAVPGSGA
ncbi:hypothetical protein ACFY00_17865 [Kitasatospora sp. NPDC001540]|uniref:hypothetical protein n=1 Tax=Kitasatospora sp. NPDC001540 TaxID=3364014 RepID=UPI00367ECB5C